MVESVPGDDKAGTMSLLHSFYCWGQMGVVLLTHIFLQVFGRGAWFVLPLVWSAIPLFNLFCFIKVPLAAHCGGGGRLAPSGAVPPGIFLGDSGGHGLRRGR